MAGMEQLQKFLSRNPTLRQFLSFFRIMIILGCLGFVCVGWTRSLIKYVSGQTSISNIVNETNAYRFPSVTFCPKFKGYADLVKELDKKANETGKETIEQIGYEEIVENLTLTRDEFLTFFTHPPGKTGNPALGLDVLTNDSLWETSIPHPSASGQCHTYNSHFESYASKWYGVRFGIKLPKSENLSSEAKIARLQDLKIFIHDPGQFMFYEEDDRPHSHKLDMSWFRLGQENSLSIKFSRFTALTKKDRVCTDDITDYGFRDCVKHRFNTWRKCQPPWEQDVTSTIPSCSNIRNISNLFSTKTTEADQDLNQHFFSTLSLSQHTECPLPCTVSMFDIHYSSYPPPDWHKWMDNGADWIVYLWFKNYKFQYDTEYVVCDYTCLIGEIGGNLGFFLGGSVLAYMNTIVKPLLETKTP